MTRACTGASRARDSQTRNLKNDDATSPVAAERKIQALYARLNSGEDFATVAQEYSEDPSSAPGGGDMGFLPASSLERNLPLKKVVLSLQVGGFSGIIQTAAGRGTSGFSGDGGQAKDASFTTPYGLSVDPAGNLYVLENSPDRVRRVDAMTGLISTIAGTGSHGFSGDGGPATSAMLNVPQGVAVAADDTLYIADRSNHRIRRVDANGIIATVAGRTATK